MNASPGEGPVELKQNHLNFAKNKQKRSNRSIPYKTRDIPN